MDEKIKIIYIVGEGRSGSTLLEKILSAHTDIFGTGELIHIWERGFLENQLCSCGNRFYSCSFWSDIAKEFSKNDAEKMLNIQNKNFTKKNFYKYFVKNILQKNDNDFEFYQKTYHKLISLIAKKSKKKILVDSSKQVVYPLIVTKSLKIEPIFLHLVRDSRGVAYSWQKKKMRPEIVDRKEYMPKYSAIRSSMSWLLKNAIANYLYFESKHYMIVKYEDLVDNPYKIINNIFRLLKLDYNNKFVFKDKTIYFKKNHLISGNPMRFKTGLVKLKLDEEWKNKMSRSSKLIVTSVTYPFLKKYGYV